MSGDGRIKGIVFDKDGTLFDFASTWEAWALAFLRRLGEDESHAQAMAEAIGFDFGAQRFQENSPVIAGMPSEIALLLHPHLPDMQVPQIEALLNAEAARAPQAEAVPLAPLLARLRAAGLKLGVATNDAEQPARAHLSTAGITGAFDFIAGFDTGYGGKPAPGQLRAFCDVMELEGAACVMVGDSLHDLRAGRAAGMWCVAVLTGMAGEGDLAPYADAVLPDIGHLPGWLGVA